MIAIVLLTILAGAYGLPIYGITGLTPVSTAPYGSGIGDDSLGYLHGFYSNVRVPVEPTELQYYKVYRNLGEKIYKDNVLVFSRVPGKQGDLAGCFVSEGLASLSENPCTKRIYEEISTGSKKTGLLFHPRYFDVDRLYKLKNLNVTGIHVPEGTAVSNLTNAMRFDVPWLLILNETEVQNNTRVWSLVKMGDIPTVPNGNVKMEVKTIPIHSSLGLMNYYTYPYYPKPQIVPHYSNPQVTPYYPVVGVPVTSYIQVLPIFPADEEVYAPY